MDCERKISSYSFVQNTCKRICRLFNTKKILEELDNIVVLKCFRKCQNDNTCVAYEWQNGQGSLL